MTINSNKYILYLTKELNDIERRRNYKNCTRSTCLIVLLKDLKFVIFLDMFGSEFQSFGPIQRIEFKPYVVGFGLGSERI